MIGGTWDLSVEWGGGGGRWGHGVGLGYLNWGEVNAYGVCASATNK